MGAVHGHVVDLVVDLLLLLLEVGTVGVLVLRSSVVVVAGAGCVGVLVGAVRGGSLLGLLVGRVEIDVVRSQLLVVGSVERLHELHGGRTRPRTPLLLVLLMGATRRRLMMLLVLVLVM